MKLAGSDFEKIQSALLNAFSHENTLSQMVTFKLDENLQKIAKGEDLSAIVFRLIRWAADHDKVTDLVLGAHKHVPGNQELRALAEDEEFLERITPKQAVKSTRAEEQPAPLAPSSSQPQVTSQQSWETFISILALIVDWAALAVSIVAWQLPNFDLPQWISIYGIKVSLIIFTIILFVIGVGLVVRTIHKFSKPVNGIRSKPWLSIGLLLFTGSIIANVYLFIQLYTPTPPHPPTFPIPRTPTAASVQTPTIKVTLPALVSTVTVVATPIVTSTAMPTFTPMITLVYEPFVKINSQSPYSVSQTNLITLETKAREFVRVEFMLQDVDGNQLPSSQVLYTWSFHPPDPTNVQRVGNRNDVLIYTAPADRLGQLIMVTIQAPGLYRVIPIQVTID